MTKEQHAALQQARQADEREIESLQKEVAEAESRLASQEERWRDKILEAQGVMALEKQAPGSRGPSPPPPPGSPGSPPPPGGAPRGRRPSKETIADLEKLSERVTAKDAKIVSLESQLEKLKAEKEDAIAQERMRVRKLELELNIVSEGDTMKLRQALRTEHDAQVRQITEAAQESVQTLQTLLDQAEERVRSKEEEVAKLMETRAINQAKYAEDTKQLQHEISQLREELLKVSHQSYGPDVSWAGAKEKTKASKTKAKKEGSFF
eukprot:TRINITY_DN17518_c0_g1_i2.p1 TRINITY_DN17518_c0_g1~~TRINITY_DN17518_c0_g1_i2.p1  ORF type:complete len:287 (-),score=85.26 TRINITY_DN17518_c0_g1_i2:371-1165(-)